MNAAVGVFGGLFLGLGFVFFRESIDRRIHAPGEAQVYLNVTELGVTTTADRMPSRQIAGTGWTNRFLALLPTTNLTDQSEPLLPWNRDASTSADCYRSIVTSMLFTGQNGDNPRVVVVTSPCQGDGKTTVASHLSCAVVEIGKTVLLIDGDLRRPRLHELFGLSNHQGLSHVLQTDTPLDQKASFQQLLHPTETSGLYIMPAGSVMANSASVFHSHRMSALLERLRGEFDMVIVDAPPVLPVPDARVLGRLADGIILVIRAGQTTIENAFIARQRFAEDGTRVLGTILNGWNPKAGRRYGYGGYYGPHRAAG
jgi:capsular exopolysaccharide synthesis family protein